MWALCAVRCAALVVDELGVGGRREHQLGRKDGDIRELTDAKFKKG